jgi:SAM-dependent methyltransferase
MNSFMSRMCNPTLHCPCERRVGATSFTYNSPPEGETRFDLGGQIYRRSYWLCGLCGHEFAEHDLDLSGLYSGAYVNETYGALLRRSYDRILALPPEQSDNSGRVRRILDFAADHFTVGYHPSLLDVGAGMGVFPLRMKEAGWNCTALDPDPMIGQHLADVVGVRAVVADFLDVKTDYLGQFDVISLNKVIEHVDDPYALLRKAAIMLNRHGFLYVEVPDVAAAVSGPSREEYFIEHLHVFSPASLAMLVKRTGLNLVSIERLREPSGKYTLRGFIFPGNGTFANASNRESAYSAKYSRLGEL